MAVAGKDGPAASSTILTGGLAALGVQLSDGTVINLAEVGSNIVLSWEQSAASGGQAPPLVGIHAIDRVIDRVPANPVAAIAFGGRRENDRCRIDHRFGMPSSASASPPPASAS